MTTKNEKRASGPSGKHVSPRRAISQSQEEWDLQYAHAAERGQSWVDWARETLENARKKQSSTKK